MSNQFYYYKYIFIYSILLFLIYSIYSYFIYFIYNTWGM